MPLPWASPFAVPADRGLEEVLCACVRVTVSVPGSGCV